ncbi:probable cytosolic oligopeptidase A [Nilaparvata lugens]|uniref:probable cytosolic oligopeptidase A n=1 Tax=Nilaparvata lugens TaxID=108931 RepID=UPI00193E3C0F|nr:probable cytosolic oligopeptidase A [Nilaparvata lugens]
MAVSLCSKRFKLHLKNSLIQQYRKGYIVLLPELEPNLPEQNPLFKDGYPNFEDIETEKVVTTLGKHLLDFEHQTHVITKQLEVPDNEGSKDEHTPEFIKKVAEPLERVGIPLATSWGIAKTLYLTNCQLMPANKFAPLNSRAHGASCSKYVSPTIYEASKSCDDEKLSEEEHRLVEKFRLEGALNGLALSPEKRELHQIYKQRLASEQADFKKKVQINKQFFKTPVTDPQIVAGFPEKLIKQISLDKNEPSRGPWSVPVDSRIRDKFLEYCPDKFLREKVWINSIIIGSNEAASNELKNSFSLEKIREYRESEAKVLGYEHYAALSMETKMAGSLDNVLGALELLREKARPAHEKELAELQKFCDKSGFRSKLTLADIPYWQRKMKKSLYNFENEELRDYFPMEKVMNGALELCQRLFDIRIQESDKVSTWHPQVKFFHVFEGDSTQPIAGFYLDPFAREEKVQTVDHDWVVSIRPAHAMDGKRAMPLSAVILNVAPPAYGKPALMSFTEVESFFGLIGKLLQQLLCSVTYSDLSGLSNVEWDTVAVSSYFMQHWLYNEKVLKSISGHYSTGAELPVKDIHLLPHHMAATSLCAELFKANLDLKLFSQTTFWIDLVNGLWDQHFAVPQHPSYNEPLSMVDIVCDSWTAAYYSHLWSRMLAADIYNAFLEEDADEASVGARFRGTYLEFGGGCDPHEVFRRFRGRDPSPNAYLRYLGLLH